MLGTIVLLFVLIGLSHCASPNTLHNKNRGLRFIAFNETARVWLSAEEIQKLSNDRVGFMDVTDFPESREYHVQFDVPTEPAFQDIVNPLLPRLSSAQLQEYVRILSSFQTRYYTSPDGEAAAHYLVEEYQKHSGSRSDISVHNFVHSWRQNSIVARIHGEGPNADEVVIIGGHIDSTSSSGAAPGADDDASGSCTVLEVFRVLATSGFKPKRTLEFHGYSAEEVGLRGSQEIVNDYVNRGVEVVGMMQLDMTGYVGGNTELIGIITDYNDAQLSQFTRLLVETYTSLPWADTRCGYACSDHASWNRAGFRSVYPNEGLVPDDNPYIHSSRDLQSLLTPSHMLEITKLALSFAVEMSLAE